MMDFENAAKRLAQDQQKLRGRRNVVVSAKAKREADYRKKQQERMREERQRKQRQENFVQQYMTSCDRALSVKPLSKNSEGLVLKPTSIWGEGDKISLPPSVLEFLTQSSDGDNMMAAGGPWTFRIGLLNPNYTFPESVILQTMKPTEEEAHDDDHIMESDLEDEEHASTSKEAYLDELGFKYIAYTHGTVVEFTQEEDHVGLPAPMAAALLDPKRRKAELQSFHVPSTRTSDPSQQQSTDATTAVPMEEDSVEKTPGHVAYGAFDVPDMPVEITMVKLPKGKGCTLTPTKEAIENGFYNLKDVKLVLEQSLIRTRATLSVGDTVHTWHRGTKFDLTVSNVIPAAFHAVTCINTDIEVEIGQVEQDDQVVQNNSPTNNNAVTSNAPTENGGQTLSGGRVLSSSPPVSAVNTTAAPMSSVELISEPPADQKENVCTIQIRGDGFAPGKRRFDIQKATMKDLFAFATSLTGLDPTIFQLCSRFPRTVYMSSSTTMADAGVQTGQEMLMVERL